MSPKLVCRTTMRFPVSGLNSRAILSQLAKINKVDVCFVIKR
ncbi:hypothetical protein PNIG_a2733 [Pseudoalteromonas nigrifaciens]|uniref:Uncharacterized protein n=2 Tax=Pseudoalteromonas TaxID=53246 RepID=A0AAC9UJC2_9GAMM|nr:hypothetical protein PTRA_a2533 [Pseudoalteromonas translucida KMM 520]ASM54718.1 hypothetical protein PNIG_a2733 [Pseudoalteromonas nigrifaciens]